MMHTVSRRVLQFYTAYYGEKQQASAKVQRPNSVTAPSIWWTIQREMLLLTQLCQLVSNPLVLKRLVPNVVGTTSFRVLPECQAQNVQVKYLS